MKEIKQVRGTMAEVLLLEVNKDTVYVRSNVTRIDEDTEEGFHGWEYNETQIAKDEYIEKIAKEKNILQETVDVLILSSL